MQALIAYETQTGHTKKTAEAIGEAVRAQGGEATVRYIRRITAEDVQAADVLFVGTWAHGFFIVGVHPAGMDEWGPKLPDMTGKPAAVFCTYLLTPRSLLKQLSKMLEGRGARIIGRQKFHARQPTRNVDAFVREVLAALG
jgi:flavodoxin